MALTGPGAPHCGLRLPADQDPTAAQPGPSSLPQRGWRMPVCRDTDVLDWPRPCSITVNPPVGLDLGWPQPPSQDLPWSLPWGSGAVPSRARLAPGSPLVWGELLDRDVSPKISFEGTRIVGTSIFEAFRVRWPGPYTRDTACLNSRYQLPFPLHCCLFSFPDTLNLYHIDDSPKYGIIYIIYIYIIPVWQRWVSPLFWWNCILPIETVLSEFLVSLSSFPCRPKVF